MTINELIQALARMPDGNADIYVTLSHETTMTTYPLFSVYLSFGGEPTLVVDTEEQL